MFCTGFPSGSAFSTESSLWSGGANLVFTTLPKTSLSARLAPAYLRDLGRPVSGAQGRGSLRSAERGILVVPFARTASMQNRSFSVAGPRVSNDLPQELRLFPRLCTDTFLGHLKTYLFVRTGVGSASE